MKGEIPPKFVSDRRYVDATVAMARFLELANAAEADKGRIAIGPINRTMLDEGASVEEYRAGLGRALAEGLLELHQSGAYVNVHRDGRGAVRLMTKNDSNCGHLKPLVNVQM